MNRVEHFSTEQGLSHNSVLAIAQDKQSFLWMGTQDGLNRFDGYEFKVFRNDLHDPRSLSTSNIRTLYADRKGNIWVGTGSGLNRWDPTSGSFAHYVHEALDVHSLSNNIIQCVYEDRQGAIWVSTGVGLDRLDPATGQCDRFPGVATDSLFNGQGDVQTIYTIYEDSRGFIWLSQGSGISVLNPKTGTIRQMYRGRMGSRWILSDQKGTLLLGIADGVLRFDPDSDALVSMKAPRQFQDFFPSATGRGLVDANGQLWSRVPRGLFRYDPLNGTGELYPIDTTNTDLLRYNFRSVCADRSNIIWISTSNGVYKFFPTVKHFGLYRLTLKEEERPNSNNVRSFAEDRTGAIWVATLGGLNRFDPRTKLTTRIDERRINPTETSGPVFWSVVVDSKSPELVVFVGKSRLVIPRRGNVSKPLASFPVRRLEALDRRPNRAVHALFQDHLGSIWIGYDNSAVARYDPKEDSLKYFRLDAATPGRLSPGTIIAITETPEGSIWIGTISGGLFRLDRTTEAITNYVADPNDVNSLGDNGVLSLLPDEAGVLWVGTYGGLDRFDKQRNSFRRYTTKDGLANNVIYGILKDVRGYLWLSSNLGITRFNPATGLVKNYKLSDGLQDYEFNHNSCLRSSTGVMYFGGISGFNYFHPDSIKDNMHLPTIVPVNLKILNKNVEPGAGESRILTGVPTTRELFLDHDDAVFTFEFAAMEFTDPALNQYAYMMEGFDREWQYVGTKREATYTNLDPGTYTLRVKATNNDGVWNEAGLAIVVHIAPPYWMTWWFRSILVLIFLSVGPIIYYRRVTGLKKEFALQQEFSRRLIDSQEQERRRIATELHDSIGQELLVIKNRTYLALQIKRLNPQTQEQLDHITRIVTRSLQSVRQIARNLRPYHLDRVGLTEAIRSTLQDVAQSSTIKFDIRVDTIDAIFSATNKNEMEVNVFRVVQESVNNILKHSQAKHASVAIGTSDHQLTIVIQDDGKGFDPAVINSPQSKAGLGVSGISERVRILNGSYSLESSPGAGTTVRISVPVTAQGRS
jgi:signal transduction histidine kinase/ligand-binding sensor domain-containing protein